MKNMIDKEVFRGLILGTSVLIAAAHFMGVPFLLIVMITEWVLLIYLLCLLSGQNKEEKKALNEGAAGFFGKSFIQPAQPFNGIVKECKPCLLMAKLKWVVGLLLLSATIFYILSFSNISLIHPLFVQMKIVSFYTLATIFLGITLGSMILMMWLGSNFPMLRWVEASFYCPTLEEREGMEIAKSSNKVARPEEVMKEVIIAIRKKGCLVVPHAFLVLVEGSPDSSGKLKSGKILIAGKEPVFSHLKLKKGEIKRDIQSIEKPIVIQ